MKSALTTDAFRKYVPIITDEVQSYFKKNPDFKGASGVANISTVMAQITIFTASHSLQGYEIRQQFDVLSGAGHNVSLWRGSWLAHTSRSLTLCV